MRDLYWNSRDVEIVLFIVTIHQGVVHCRSLTLQNKITILKHIKSAFSRARARRG